MSRGDESRAQFSNVDGTQRAADPTVTTPKEGASFNSMSSTASPSRWNELFRTHLEVIEAHVRILEEVQQSVRPHTERLNDEETAPRERFERENWMTICGMVDRAKEVLDSARKAANEFGNTEMSGGAWDSKITGDMGMDGSPVGAESKPKPNLKDKEGSTGSKKRKSYAAQHESGRTASKFSKSDQTRAASETEGEEATREEALPVRPTPQIDFRAIEAQLHAEVQAGLQRQAQRAAETTTDTSKDDKKKRKRSSVGGEGVVETKKVKGEERSATSTPKSSSDSLKERKIKALKKRKVDGVVQTILTKDGASKKLKRAHE